MLTQAAPKRQITQKVNLSRACRLLGINRQAYYRYIWSIERKQKQSAKAVQMVLELRDALPRIGGRKLYYLLHAQLRELGIGRDKFFDIMRSNYLLVPKKRSYRMTTNSRHHFKKHRNLIAGQRATRPNQIWVSDITYVNNGYRHCYLSLVTDLYSKKIVGYDLSSSLDASGAIRALKMGLKGKSKKVALIHHSDRGIQYCCTAYQRLLEKNAIRCSMTETYDPYANAVAERINGILKQEFDIGRYNLPYKFKKLIVKQAVDSYNNLRPHWSNDLETPNKRHLCHGLSYKTYEKRRAA